jgi:hypothetical protein
MKPQAHAIFLIGRIGVGAIGRDSTAGSPEETLAAADIKRLA